MKKVISVLTSNLFPVFIISLLISTRSQGQSPATDPHWTLYQVWDFKTMSATTLNQEWVTDPCVKALDHGNHNVEPQSYQGSNVSISAAGLKLTVKDETVWDKVICYEPNNYLLSDTFPNYRPSYYTSGWVETYDSLQYGYIESRMKIPYGYDYFPAFWTFKVSSAAANGNEIDIFEMLPAEFYPFNSHIAKTNCHLFYGAPGEPYDEPRNQLVGLSSPYTNYHTYAVEWNPTKIIWYFDNEIVRVMQNPGVHDYTKTIINLALNPWVGNPSLTTYPASMEIDYVKWYKINSSHCTEVVNDCAFNFGTYSPTVKKSITIGNTGCSNTQPANTSIVLRATDFILFNGEFTVPTGCTLYADVNACY